MRKKFDPLITARATAVLELHFRIRLDKEDVHLYPILRKRTTESEQASIVRLMSRNVLPERFHALVKWLPPLLNFNDRVVVTEGRALKSRIVQRNFYEISSRKHTCRKRPRLGL